MKLKIKLQHSWIPGSVTGDITIDGAEHTAQKLLSLLEILMATLADLEAAVKAQTTVVKSAITLIEGIAQRIIDAGVDPAKLTALTDELTADTASLAAAVQANTPAA